MPGRRLTGSKALIAVAVVGAGVACGLGTHASDLVIGARITKIQAFYCAVHSNTDPCQVRADSIPAGTLPPANEYFLVYVWAPASNDIEWRLVSALDSALQPYHTVTYDSAAVSYYLNGAPAKQYTVLVRILGPNNTYLATDSLHWQFP